MKWNRRFTTLALAFALAAGLSCTTSDSTTPLAPTIEPQSSPSFGIGDLTGGVTPTVVGTLGDVTNLLTCSPQRYVVTTRTIGPKGGVIEIGEHRLVIPRNALSGKTKITAEQMRGSTNSVRFSPEGLRFQKPAELTISYENCSGVLLKKQIVYTTEALSILELLKSRDYPKYDYVTSPIDHFSRYAVAY